MIRGTSTFACAARLGCSLLRQRPHGMRLGVARASPAMQHMRAYTSIRDDVAATHDVLDKPKFTQLRKRLEADERYRMPRSEYLSLAQDYGLEEAEATKFFTKLEDAMVIMNFQQAPDWVFLKPERLSKHMHDVLDPDASQSNAAIQRKSAELKRLLTEKEALDLKRTELQSRAHAKATRFMWYCTGAMVVQAGVVARLTWWELSWDIMEPITYLITYGTGILALMYFGLTRAEYTYEGLHSRIAHKHEKKLFKKENYDAQHYAMVVRKIDLLQQDLRVLGAPWTAPPHLESDDVSQRATIVDEAAAHVVQ